MSDILFKTDDHIFSYRVAEICVQNSKVLLQKPTKLFHLSGINKGIHTATGVCIQIFFRKGGFL